MQIKQTTTLITRANKNRSEPVSATSGTGKLNPEPFKYLISISTEAETCLNSETFKTFFCFCERRDNLLVGAVPFRRKIFRRKSSLPKIECHWGTLGWDRTALYSYSLIALVRACIPFCKGQIRGMWVDYKRLNVITSSDKLSNATWSTAISSWVTLSEDIFWNFFLLRLNMSTVTLLIGKS